ncbi:MAG TPA: ATP-dependent RecD-like DNA helicase [Candidatus Binatia bacterium]|jgi:exodeoxyribonuclease V alpha subunit|nr:ATP-dependent RecD-like DNA helicase [Candidatus Binatia bacterium]
MAEKREGRSVLQGTVTRITYQDPEGHYTVARMEIDKAEEITVVGALYPVSEGEEIKVSGSWRIHPRYGLQFQSERWEKLEPATLEGIERYLGSGLIKGIGPTYARRLVSAFGLDTLRVLSEEPQRVLEVQGIGEIRAQRILKAWEEQKGMREAMIFLQGHGISSSLALKIYRTFGTETVIRVKENPYSLAREVYGVGFVLADRIAASMGITGDFPLRVQAGLLYILRKSTDEGHCFVPMSLLKRNGGSVLKVSEEAIESGIKKLSVEGEILLESVDGGETRLYPREIYNAEKRVASALRSLMSAPSALLLPDRIQALERAQAQMELLLEAEQREAVLQALQQKVLVITGGPGTGKTTLLNSLLVLLRRSKISFALAAPTGRAAKRMAEMAGEEARTIHRLLEYSPREGRFQRGEENPLEVDVIIIDEVSMVDLPLMDSLLRAVARQSHLILIGDVDQLPSVGPGSVLKDLIESGVVPVVVLRRIFRQGSESLITVNAHRILGGQFLLLDGPKGERDFVFLPRENEEDILETVKSLVKTGFRDQGSRGLRDSQPFNFLSLQSFNEVQVLTPMHRGLLGTVHLNRELQKLLNQSAEAVERGETVFRVGDKVMQLRNNYDKGVFNGDLGRVIQIDREEGELQIDYDGRAISYSLDELDDISLAYATSIHKSQGSEYPEVIIPLHTSHYPMLHRSILYTAVTRGKRLVVLVGSKRALAMAIKNVRVERRFTGLKERLMRA